MFFFPADPVPFTLQYVGGVGLFPSNVTAELNWNDGVEENTTLNPGQTSYSLSHIFPKGVYDVSVRVLNKVSERTWSLTMGGPTFKNV